MSEMSLDESHGDDFGAGSGRDNMEKYKVVMETLKKIDLCGQSGRDCANEQRLLNNMGVHNVVLELIQVPYDKVGVEWWMRAWVWLDGDSRALLDCMVVKLYVFFTPFHSLSGQHRKAMQT